MAEKKNIPKGALVELVIKGRVDLPRAAFDVGRYQEVTRDKLEALNVNVKLRVEGQHVDVIERELEGLGRREIEETVLKKLLLADERYKGRTEVLLPALFDIKDAVLGHRPEDYSEVLHERLLKLFKQLGSDVFEDDGKGEEEREGDSKMASGEDFEASKEPKPKDNDEPPKPKNGRWF
jgi:hypothetical protein